MRWVLVLLTLIMSPMSHAATNKICVLLGYPGSGKGTVAQAQDPQYYEQFSFGDLLRDEMHNRTVLGAALKDRIEMKNVQEVKLLNDDIVNELFEERLLELITTGKNIIIDGYPRTIAQADNLQHLGDKYGLKIIYVYLKADRDILIKRMQTRVTCAKCHKIYNTEHQPGKLLEFCDICGEKLTRRGSDDLANINKRLTSFDAVLPPLLNYYRKNHKLVEFDGNLQATAAGKEFTQLLNTYGF